MASVRSLLRFWPVSPSQKPTMARACSICAVTGVTT
jgi:hypothetical protein